MKRTLNFAVVGASGKMGQELFHVLTVQKISCFGISKSGQAENYKKTFQIQKAPFRFASGIIDFSLPSAFDLVLRTAVENKIPLVCGTTGLSKKQIAKMKAAGKKIPILWSANMSLGIAVLKKALQSFAKLNDFDFQIEEYHHKRKKDSPSGTAIVLQENLKKIIKKDLPEILSIRAGGIIGVHKVHAISEEEHLIFEHTALNRKVFAKGAVQAALWLQKQKNGIYSIEDLICE